VGRDVNRRVFRLVFIALSEMTRGPLLGFCAHVLSRRRGRLAPCSGPRPGGIAIRGILAEAAPTLHIIFSVAAARRKIAEEGDQSPGLSAGDSGSPVVLPSGVTFFKGLWHGLVSRCVRPVWTARSRRPAPITPPRGSPGYCGHRPAGRPRIRPSQRRTRPRRRAPKAAQSQARPRRRPRCESFARRSCV
jgi:hypothetical protein